MSLTAEWTCFRGIWFDFLFCKKKTKKRPKKFDAIRITHSSQSSQSVKYMTSLHISLSAFKCKLGLTFTSDYFFDW